MAPLTDLTKKVQPNEVEWSDDHKSIDDTGKSYHVTTDTALAGPQQAVCFENCRIQSWDRRHSHAAIRRSIVSRDLYKQEVIRPREKVFDYREGMPGTGLERKEVDNVPVWLQICVANRPSLSFIPQSNKV